MALLKHNNNSISNVTSFAQITSGEPRLLSTATASASASIEFNNTFINSSYKIYKFEFISIHPQTDNVGFTFNMSTDNGSSYNVTKTSTYFRAYHNEVDTAAVLGYEGDHDLAQSTGEERLTVPDVGGDTDESISGSILLFNPASSVYVKHYISRVNYYHTSNLTVDSYKAGYGNTTSAVNAVRFQMTSGNIDAGQIKLYGIGAN